MKLLDLYEEREERTYHYWEVDPNGKRLRTYVGDIDVGGKGLTSLRGAPLNVAGRFNCGNNFITSLEGAPEVIARGFYVNNNDLTSLKDVHKHVKEIRGTFNVRKNPIKSHVLGVLYIKGLKSFMFGERDLDRNILDDHVRIEAIIGNYLPNKGGHKWVLECQSRLLDAGFDDYAQL